MSDDKPDIPLMQRQIEAQIDEYAAAIMEYGKFLEQWRRENAIDEAVGKDRAGMA